MSNEQRPNPRLAEDVQFGPSSGPARYNHTTDGPVRFLAVANDQGAVLGYLWANDADDAVAWQSRPAMDPEATNGSFLWVMKLREFKAQGVAPTAVLEALMHDAGDIQGSHVVPGSVAEAGSLAALKDLAAQA